MRGKRKPTSTRSSQYVCRSCRQPVDAVVDRHKSMGVYVPLWTAGPCHNPKCDQYVPEQVAVSSVRSTVWKNLTGWTPH